VKQTFCIFLLILCLSPSAQSGGTYGSTLCKEEGYHCVRVKGGQSWRSLWPDVHDRDIVMRINRMNTQLYPGLRIAVPNNLKEADIMDFAPFPAETNTAGEKLIVVDPQTRAWGAYDETGNLIRWGPASAGADWCRDIDEACHTHPGAFRVFTLGSSNCYSTKFPLPNGGAPMPYCMYFNNGQALHGEPNGLPGYNASHGCVRLYVNDAEWLRYDFAEGPNSSNDYRGTQVLVKPYETPEEDDDEYAHAKDEEEPIRTALDSKTPGRYALPIMSKRKRSG
jgi:L,D-transpeptidase ErfK/SrfK